MEKLAKEMEEKGEVSNLTDTSVVSEGASSMPKDVKRSFIFMLVSILFWFMAYNAVTTAFSRYCVEIWKVDLGTSSSYLLMATIAAIAAFVPLGFLSNKLGRKKTILLGIIELLGIKLSIG